MIPGSKSKQASIYIYIYILACSRRYTSTKNYSTQAVQVHLAVRTGVLIDLHLAAQTSSTCTSGSSRRLQVRPSWSQIHPQSVQVGPKSAQVGPQSVQVGPKSVQVGPKCVQVGAQTPVQDPLNSPKRRTTKFDDSTTLWDVFARPSWPQERSSWSPERPSWLQVRPH